MGDNPVQESVFDKTMNKGRPILSHLVEADKYNILNRQSRFNILQPGGPGQGSKVKALLNFDRPTVFFDLETTGLGEDRRILSISATRYERNASGSVVKRRLNKFSPWPGEVNPESLDVHKLDPARLLRRGARPFTEHAPQVFKFFEGAVIAGYNSNSFDIPLLGKELALAGLRLPSGGRLDISDIYKRFYSDGWKLSKAFESLTGTKPRAGHSARGDVRSSESVLSHLVALHNLPTDISALSSGALGSAKVDPNSLIFKLGTDIETAYGKPLGQGGESLGDVFSKISSKFNINFAYNSSNKELYMLSESGKTQVALPLQYVPGLDRADNLESGLVHMGGTSRGAYKARFLGETKEYTFAELFYEKLAALVNKDISKGDFLRLASKIRGNLIGRGIKGAKRMDNLLGPVANIRGTSITAIEAKRFAARAKVFNRDLSTDRDSWHPVQKMYAQFNEAKEVISTLVKTSGRALNRLSKKYGWLSGITSAKQAVRAARVKEKEWYAFIPKFNEMMGVSGHHTIKPENIGWVVSTRLGERIYGKAQSERDLTKGTFGQFHAAVNTRNQLGNIVASGGDIRPSHLRSGEFDTSDVFHSRRVKIAVISPKSAIHDMLFPGDSGSILTDLGSIRFAANRPLGGFTIQDPSQRTLLSLARLMGVDDLRTEVLGAKRLFIRPEEYLKALTSLKGPKKLRKELYGKLTKKEKRVRQLIGASGRYSGVFQRLAAFGRPFTISRKVTGDKLSVNFHSAHLVESAVEELLIEGTGKTTATSVNESHILHKYLKRLQDQGIEIVASENLYKKGKVHSAFLANFFSVAEEHGILGEAMQAVAAGTGTVTSMPWANKLGQMVIPLIGDDEEAAKTAALAFIEKQRNSGTLKGKKLARQLELGRKITGLSDVTASARMVYANVSSRADVGLDLDVKKASKLSMGGMRTLAWSAKLSGFDDVMNDPVFKIYASKLPNGLKFNSKLMDFEFDSSSTMRRFADSIGVEGYTPTSGILRSTGKGLELDGVLLKNIPSVQSFSKPGVDPADLVGSILDLEHQDKLLFLDLGSEVSINKDLLPHNMRYFPIPMMASRLKKKRGSKVIANREHPFFHYLEAIHQFQINGPSGVSRIASVLAAAVEVIINGRNGSGGMIGKKGLIAKMHTIHLPTTMPGRLVPLRGNQFNETSIFDPSRFFDQYVSRQSFTTELLKKSGYDTEQIKALQKLVLDRSKPGDFIYSMFVRHPVQRPEHGAIIRRLFLTDDPVSQRGENFIVDLQSNPLALESGEGDLDRDPGRLLFPEAEMGISSETSDILAKKLQIQQQQVAPYLEYRKALEANSSMDPLLKKELKELTAVDIYSQYVGQKTWSSGGYTIARPDERIMSVLLAEGMEGLTKRNLKVGGLSSSKIEEIQAMFHGQPVKQGAASALNAYMFQSGVKKGAEKESLETLIDGLMDLGDETRRLGFLDIDSIVGSGDELTIIEKVFYKFGAGADRERFWLATQHLLETSGAKVDSLERVKAGLAAGAAEAVAETKHTLLKGMARLLAQNIGIPTAVGALTGSLSNVSAIVEDTSKITNVHQLMKRLINPLRGDWGQLPGSGEASEIHPQVSSGEGVITESFSQQAREATATVLDNVKKLANSKYFIPAAIGVGALAAYGYANRPSLQSDSLPPPVDTSRPMDRGPVLPDYSNVGRVNTSKFVSPASRSRSNNRLTNVNGQFFNSRTDSRMTIEDKTSPSNPWLVRQQMDRVSESDFVY